ncbi:MAG TPA: hypothetical protein VF631_08900 [Allosphingosinicella sp.]|jgi:hypothetical protein|uniref:hypothetical protein n=1 Tax=Allosphingosinicella sp. TaxID=2823234 RepID=UPI002F2AD5B9
MCLALIALSFATAPCAEQAQGTPADNLPLEVSPMDTLPLAVVAHRPPESTGPLSNPELSRIRGGDGYIARTGPNGTVRLIQGANAREMNFASAPTWQQMDSW